VRNLTGSLAEFSLTACEDLPLALQQAACGGYKTGFCCATRILVGAFTECCESGEFDIDKFSRIIKPFLDDMGTHATP
jgi:hypothetical protein